MFKERKTRRGFTLAEVLIVVAIVAILLAVAIPNVIGYYRSLKLTELDDSARTIFVAAQNRLTAMKNMGADLSALGSGTKSANLSTGGTVEVRTVTEGSADDLASLVPGGSVDSRIHDNHYVVEIDPKTGAVIAVWYWEDESFNYATQAYSTVDPDKTKRLEKAQMVGYYGGTKVDRLEFGQMPFPAVNVINAEELRVEVTVPTMDFGTGNGYQENSVLVDVIVDGVEVVKDANLWPDNDPAVPRVGTVVLDTLKTVTPVNFNQLDHKSNSGNISWTYGMQYKEWETAYGATFPEPGEELTVVVRLHYDGKVKISGEDTSLMPQTVTVRCNSLFDSVDETTGTANIAYGRHLQNLDTDTSGVMGSIIGAKQTRDINFAATAKDSADPTYYYWGSTYPAQDESYENGQDGFRDFQEIINNKLTEYDGQDHEIRNMYIVAENGYGGLFSEVFYGEKLNNIIMVNPHVHEAPDQTGVYIGSGVGALIGMAGGDVEIRECKVYVDYDPEKDTPELKKQFDQVLAQKLDNMKIDTTPKGNCYVEALLGFPHIEGAEPNSSAGGLVGLFSGNISIQNSFCSIPVVGQLNAGGLVGNASTCNISISKSYSASFVYGHGTVGGLVGHAGDSYSTIKIENCYAAGEIMNGNPSSFIGAGLVNIHENANIEGIVNNYSAVKFVNATGAPKTGSGEEKQGTVYGTYNGDNSSANYYIPDPAVTKGYGNQASGGFVPCGEKVTTADLLEKFKGKPGWTAGAGKAHPYRLLTELDGLPEVYPYPMLTDKPHYGDWLPKATGYSFGYYDNGGGSSYGFWGYIFDPATGTATPANSLAVGTTGSSGNYATDDGYCIAVEAGGAPPAVITVEGVTSGISTEQITGGTYTDSATGKTYDLYKVKGLDGVSKTKYYNKITVGTTEYWFNPFFACEVKPVETGDPANGPANPIAKDGAAGQGTSGNYNGQVVIRTARQLANMAEHVNGNSKVRQLEYVQLLNIDFNEYNESVKGKETGGGSWEPMRLENGGSYNGNEFVINNLYIASTEANNGLFGKTSGKLENIRLKNVKLTGKDYAGTLAGRFEGTEVNNCGVYVDSGNYNNSDYTITGDNHVGGLIGHINSVATLTKCFAAVKVEGESNQVGGLIGSIFTDSGETTLVNCYSGGYAPGGKYAPDSVNVIGDEQVGGLIGSVSGSQAVKLSGVNFSTCSVQMKSTSASRADRIGLLVGYDTSGLIYKATTDIAYATGMSYGNAGTVTIPRLEGAYFTPAKAKTATTLPKPGDPSPTVNSYSGLSEYIYPLPADDITYYGDWPTSTDVNGIAYVEHEDGEYRYYIVGEYSDGRVVLYSTLSDKQTGTSGNIDACYFVTFANKFTTSQFPSVPTGAGLSESIHKDDTVWYGIRDALRGVLDDRIDEAIYEPGSTVTEISIDSKYSSTIKFHCTPGYANVGISTDTSNMFGGKNNPNIIRTAQQLDNIEGSSSNKSYFKQTHDINGDGYSTYTSNKNFAGHYDGGGYVIKDLDIKRHGLFDCISSNGTVEFENIILYTTNNLTIIGDSDTLNAGGIAANIDLSGGGTVTITNCVVAGYNLTSDTYGGAGGLVGYIGTSSGTNKAKATIEKCEALNNITNATYAGGLVGTVTASGSALDVEVSSSYAGGGITGTTSVGGLVGVGSGADADISYKNVYSYVDMSGATGATLYGIGPNGTSGSYDKCHYWWDSGWGATAHEDSNSLTGVNKVTSLSDLENCMSGASDFGTAAKTYGTGTSVSGGAVSTGYPYPAVVKDHDGNYVHYGDWKED